MAFFLKKLISAFLLPLPLSLFFICIGILLLLINKYKLSGLITICTGFLLLLLFSLNWIPYLLLNHLEQQYPPLFMPPANVSTIVVLGGGIGGNSTYPPNTRINSATLSRLVEAIRLTRILNSRHIQPTLMLSGGRIFRYPSETGKMKNTIEALGIQQQQIAIENGSKDTYQEAVYLKPRLNNKPFILITSASHMPRAMALFIKQGLHPIPAPTQFLAKENNNFFKSFIPSATNLVYSDIAIHEYLGMLWERWQRQIVPNTMEK